MDGRETCYSVCMTLTCAERLQTQEFILSILARGWHWCESHTDRLVHPADNDISIQYDRTNDRLMASPKLDDLLQLVILTPQGKSKSFWRRTAN